MTSANQMSNFGFLEEHDSLFVQLAFSAERAFASDPNTTLIKLRQLGEALAQQLAALEGIYFDDQTSQADLLNQNAALALVANKPRDLTREQLKENKLLLDGAGYSEAKLQSAVRNQTNQDIAASIIGHIRRAAFGEPLIPFEQRVAHAMLKTYQSHNWLPAQSKWLERLAKQLVHEVIIDRDFVNNRFAEQGSAKQLNRVLGNQLDFLLDELSEAIWPALG